MSFLNRALGAARARILPVRNRMLRSSVSYAIQSLEQRIFLTIAAPSTPVAYESTPTKSTPTGTL